MKKIIIRNSTPRRDTQGEIIDAHEYDLEFFDGRYYIYGMGYGDRSGWTDENVVNCYSSPDLEKWTRHGALMENVRIAIPAVKYNSQTGLYVMWFIQGKQCMTSVSEHPIGPFSQPEHAPVYGAGAGDFSLFIDDDDTGYIIRTSSSGDRSRPKEMHQIIIERLTDDYRGGTGDICGPMAWNCEAPAMFSRKGVYYVLFDNTCCWNPAGTGCRVYTSESPLGPYEYRGNINRDVSDDPRKIASRNDDTEPGSGREDVIIPMQTRRAVEIRTAAGVEIILTGDMWGSADDGLKGHDYTYWTSPLKFDPDGMIRQLRWQDQWYIFSEPRRGRG